MSYDSRLYIVLTPEQDENGTPTACRCRDGVTVVDTARVAEIELGGGTEGAVHDLVQRSLDAEKNRRGNEPWFYVVGDSDSGKDAYGDPVAPIPLPLMIDAIRTATSTEEHYRRYPATLVYLEALQAQIVAGDWDEGLFILHYGH